MKTKTKSRKTMKRSARAARPAGRRSTAAPRRKAAPRRAALKEPGEVFTV